MAIIKVRGLGKVFCPNDQGLEIKRDFEAGTLPAKVVIGDKATVSGKDITGAMIEADEQVRNKPDIQGETHAEFMAHRARTLGLPPESRARNLGLFRLFWWATTGRQSENDHQVELKVYEIQRKFFMEHPKRMYCDPLLWRPLVEEVNQAGNVPDLNRNALSLVERCVNEDLVLSKRGK